MKVKLLAAALAFALAAPVIVTPAMAQHRHGWDNQHRHGWNNHNRWDRGWNRGYRNSYRNSWGPAIGFGLGLGAGAAAGAYASGADQRNDAYCSQRFRSYDPASGTYLGYDGQRHPCP
jgi:hypothetical protein